MATMVALFRGINVGRAKRISMEALASLFEEIGLREARTVLNSGNVVFECEERSCLRLAELVSRSVEARLGVAAEVVVVELRELDQVIDENPLLHDATDPSRMLVAVTPRAKDLAQLSSVTTRDWGEEAVGIGRRAAYLWCPNGVAASPLVKGLTVALAGHVTTRNWSTMLRLHAVGRSIGKSKRQGTRGR